MTAQFPLLGAVIGKPIVHSLSPVIHEAAFVAAGRAGRFVARECDSTDVAQVLDDLKSQGVIGVSVTMPLKEVIVTLVDELSPDAERLQAVNCLSFHEGRITGHNTDGDGCCDALEEIAGASISGSTAVVLGAGGAAKSVVLALVRRGAHVIVVNRTHEKAQQVVTLAAHHVPSGTGSVRVGTAESIADASILVNATSIGMNTEELPIPRELLHPGLVVLDAVYSPLDTALLRAARHAGASIVDGLWMLIDQACRQQVVWFGQQPDREAMRSAAERELASRQK